MHSTISFRLQVHQDEAIEIVPEIDGVLLTELVVAIDPMATHGGLVPDFSRFGPLVRHFLGQGDVPPQPDATVVLGCECGEWGCDPVFCRIEVAVEEVRWSDFRKQATTGNLLQLGPFKFARVDYERALGELKASIER